MGLTILNKKEAKAVEVRVEDITTLPTPSADHLGRIVKLRSGGAGISKICACVENSTRGYEWIQMAVST